MWPCTKPQTTATCAAPTFGSRCTRRPLRDMLGLRAWSMSTVNRCPMQRQRPTACQPCPWSTQRPTWRRLSRLQTLRRPCPPSCRLGRSSRRRPVASLARKPWPKRRRWAWPAWHAMASRTRRPVRTWPALPAGTPTPCCSCASLTRQRRPGLRSTPAWPMPWPSWQLQCLRLGRCQRRPVTPRHPSRLICALRPPPPPSRPMHRMPLQLP